MHEISSILFAHRWILDSCDLQTQENLYPSTDTLVCKEIKLSQCPISRLLSFTDEVFTTYALSFVNNASWVRVVVFESKKCSYFLSLPFDSELKFIIKLSETQKLVGQNKTIQKDVQNLLNILIATLATSLTGKLCAELQKLIRTGKT